MFCLLQFYKLLVVLYVSYITKSCLGAPASIAVRDSPCGNVIGGVNQGQCFRRSQDNEYCMLNGTERTYFQVKYNGGIGWVESTSSNDAECRNEDPGVCSQVRWLTREQWGARPPTSTTPLNIPVGTVFIHHTAGAGCYTEAECIVQMQNIQNYHMDTLGWNDIGYNFLVGGDGQAYEGRGWTTYGAHTGASCNGLSVAVSLIGNYDVDVPSDAVMDATRHIIDCAIQEGAVVSWTSLNMLGHRDVCATACPGQFTYGIIDDWPWYGINPSVCNC